MNFSSAAVLHPSGSGALFHSYETLIWKCPTVKCEKSFVTDGHPLVWLCAASCLSVCICVCARVRSPSMTSRISENDAPFDRGFSHAEAESLCLMVIFLLPEGRLNRLWDLQRFECGDALISLKHWSWQMAFPRLHTLPQSYPTLSGWWCGGTETHTHTWSWLLRRSDQRGLG